MFFSNFKNIKCVLLLNLHHCPSKLNSLIKILENRFLYDLHVLLLVDTATRTTAPIRADGIFRVTMTTLYSWQFIFIF